MSSDQRRVHAWVKKLTNEKFRVAYLGAKPIQGAARGRRLEGEGGCFVDGEPSGGLAWGRHLHLQYEMMTHLGRSQPTSLARAQPAACAWRGST